MTIPAIEQIHIIFNTFLGTLPVLFCIITFLVRTEHRITKLETIINRCDFCSPTKTDPQFPKNP